MSKKQNKHKIKLPKAPKRNPLVAAVMKKAVKKHKNKKKINKQKHQED